MSGAGSSSLLPLESLLLPKTSPCKRFMAIAPVKHQNQVVKNAS
jgi:hypothetical protein